MSQRGCCMFHIQPQAGAAYYAGVADSALYMQPPTLYFQRYQGLGMRLSAIASFSC